MKQVILICCVTFLIFVTACDKKDTKPTLTEKPITQIASVNKDDAKNKLIEIDFDRKVNWMLATPEELQKIIDQKRKTQNEKIILAAEKANIYTLDDAEIVIDAYKTGDLAELLSMFVRHNDDGSEYQQFRGGMAFQNRISTNSGGSYPRGNIITPTCKTTYIGSEHNTHYFRVDYPRDDTGPVGHNDNFSVKPIKSSLMVTSGGWLKSALYVTIGSNSHLY